MLSSYRQTIIPATMIWLLLLSTPAGIEGRVFRIGFLAPRNHVRLGWDITAAAATMGIEKAQQDGILAGHQVQLVYRDTGCNSVQAGGVTVQLKYDDDVDALLGPGCSADFITSAMKLSGQLAAFWNLPAFTHGATDSAITDKSVYSTVVRVAPAFSKMSSAISALCDHFSWHRITMISMRPYPTRNFCDYAGRSIEMKFRGSNITIEEWIQFSLDVSDEDIDRMLDKIKQRGRIVILCADKLEEHTILLRAQARGMTSAEYLFISLEHLPPADILTPWAGLETRHEGSRDSLIQAYRSVVQISVGSLGSAEALAVLDAIPYKMTEAPWFYNGTLESGKQPSVYSLFLHDIAYLYLMVLEDTLAKGQDHRDGKAFFQNAIGKSFKGKSGDVTIDSNGDRDPNYWLYHMGSEEADSFKFWTEIKLTNPEGQRIQITEPGRWLTEDGNPPPDVPACGFLGETCTSGRDIGIASGTCAAITLVVIGGVIVLLYRRRKQEDQLRNMMWKINPEEIQKLKDGRSRTSQMSSRSVIAMSTDKLSHMTGDDTLPDVGKNIRAYHGNQVTVHMLQATELQLSREDLVALTAMRQMANENINHFVGACFQLPKPCYLMVHCSRGSLQDIINNDDIKLDWMFKVSLSMDIVNGLQYLHASPLRSHGNLTSDTCLVDNRWVVKLSCYGFYRFLQNAQQDEEKSDEQKCMALYWTAPELVRLTPAQRPRNGTERGDVYSFGVVLQELVDRCLPYDRSYLHPKEIIDRVRQGPGPSGAAYRPTLVETTDEADPGVRDLIQGCWTEDPGQRPSLAAIKSTIRGFNKGKSVNIMDNMLSMMEKYANNLEEIVQERTWALIEEKKKTDMLLYSMLPRSVADSLKLGKNVTPESFDSVTIFFSDIVGFTSLSSESSPLQVVDLLNDLYTLFDGIIAQHDVYKVETIGDAYMVVSGLPIRNGNNHSSHIATMALDLLHAVHTQFVVRHRPGYKLKLRIGLHTGSCVAGVVGLKMPRYCLFGDTVNMASRMESNGLALRIHVSEQTEALLQMVPCFQIRERGEIEIKGKGVHKTYWLVGKDGYNKDLPAFDD